MRRRTSVPPVLPQELRKVSSLERGLEILRCFTASEQILGVNAIAGRLSIPRPSALRLLATLCEARYLARVGMSEQYRIHSEAILLGQAFLSGSTLVRRARPVLQAFVDRFQSHTVLCVPRPEGMLTLLYLHSKAVRAKPRMGPGSIFAPENTAVGHAWLWTEGPEVQSEFLARLRRAEGEGGDRGGVAELFQSFHDLERNGVCTVQDRRRGTSMSAASIDVNDGSRAIVASILNLGDQAATSVAYRLGLRDAAENVADVLLRHQQLSRNE